MSQKVNDWAGLLARILLAHMFIYSGFGKILGYAGTQGYMAAHGLWPGLLPLVILAELGGGLLILAGLYTRVAAFMVGGFSALAALFFHLDFSNMGQAYNFMKDFTIAGGMLVLVLHGPGGISLDRVLRRKT